MKVSFVFVLFLALGAMDSNQVPFTFPIHRNFQDTEKINSAKFDINLKYKCIFFCLCKAAPCGGQSPLAPFVPLLREAMALVFPGRNAANAPVALYRDRQRRDAAKERADLDWRDQYQPPKVVYVRQSNSESKSHIDLPRLSHRSHSGSSSKKHHSWQTPQISNNSDSKGKGSDSKRSTRPITYGSNGVDASDATDSVVTVGRTSNTKSPSSKSSSSSGASTSWKSPSSSTKDSSSPKTFGSSSADAAAPQTFGSSSSNAAVPQTFGGSSSDAAVPQTFGASSTIVAGTQESIANQPSSVGTVTAPTRRRRN